MRVNDNGLAGLGAAGTSRAQQTEAENRQLTELNRAGTGKSDHVRLSGLAERLQALDHGSDEREAKVEQLRAQFQAGRYQPDAEKTGESIIRDAFSRGSTGEHR